MIHPKYIPILGAGSLICCLLVALCTVIWMDDDKPDPKPYEQPGIGVIIWRLTCFAVLLIPRAIWLLGWDLFNVAIPVMWCKIFKKKGE